MAIHVFALKVNAGAGIFIAVQRPLDFNLTSLTQMLRQLPAMGKTLVLGGPGTCKFAPQPTVNKLTRFKSEKGFDANSFHVDT